MSRWSRTLRTTGRGARLGAVLAGAFYAGEAAVLLARCGSLFDPRPGGLALLAFTAGATVLAGAAAGAGLGAAAALALGAALPPPARGGARRGLAVAAAGLLLFAGAALGLRQGRACRLAQPGPRPALRASRPAPVLWVLIDTLRADTLYGASLDFPHAPNLRAFAARSLVFTDAESAAGWTQPAVATLLTGLHPTALEADRALPAWAPTAAERLRAAGYETQAVIDNALLSPRSGFTAGFEGFVQRNANRFAWFFPVMRLLPPWFAEKLREWSHANDYGAKGVTRAAVDLLGRPRGAPLFLYVHYMDPHYPYYRHPELGADPAHAEPLSVPWVVLREQGGTLRPGQLAFLTHRYAQEVRHTDSELAKLLAAWEATYGDRGLVVITADHGEEFLEHGGLAHGNSLHTELVRVPLLLRLPVGVTGAAPAAGTVATPVGHVDVLPTVLDALGVPPGTGGEPAPHGVSWLPWLRGEAPAPQRPILGRQDYKGKVDVRWRAGRWARLDMRDKASGVETFGLFDKGSDDGERRDVASREPDLAARLRAEREALVAALGQPGAGEAPALGNEEALRALGYIE